MTESTGMQLPYRLRKITGVNRWRITSSMFPEARGATSSLENIKPVLEYWFLCAMSKRFSSGQRYPALTKRADEKLFEVNNVTFHKWALWQQLHDNFDDSVAHCVRLMKPMDYSRQRAEVLLSPSHHSLVQTLRKAFTAMGYDQPCVHCYNSMMHEVPNEKGKVV